MRWIKKPQQSGSAFWGILLSLVKFDLDQYHIFVKFRFLDLPEDYRTHLLPRIDTHLNLTVFEWLKYAATHLVGFNQWDETYWYYSMCTVLLTVRIKKNHMILLSCSLLFLLWCCFIFCLLQFPTATGLGSAREVCREYLKSIATGCLHQSRVGLVLSRGSHLGNERWRVAWLRPARLHWYSACVLLHRQPIVMARSVG